MNKLLVLATGGTIAGVRGTSADSANYRSATLDVETLLEPFRRSSPDVNIEAEQLVQIDSKDMNFAIWQKLALRVRSALTDNSITGIVILHGSDTLEETAYFLERVLLPQKPVVLTCAMRAWDDPESDGPTNIHRALHWCLQQPQAGVRVVCANTAFEAVSVYKQNPSDFSAFASIRHAKPLATWQNNQWHFQREAEQCDFKPILIAEQTHLLTRFDWPWVEIFTHCVSANPNALLAWKTAGIKGLVVAATGNLTLSQGLEQALKQLQSQGIAIRITSRCPQHHSHAFAVSHTLSPVQTRVDLIVELCLK